MPPFVCPTHLDEPVHANGKGCLPCRLEIERRHRDSHKRAERQTTSNDLQRVAFELDHERTER
jgi:hypothetical protein